MKKFILTTLTLIIAFTACFAQDIITKKSGVEIQAKVLKVGQAEVEYKKYDNPEGPTYTILKSDLLIIYFENGTTEEFNEEHKNEGTYYATPYSGNLFIQGQSDAVTYYHGYTGAGTATLITGLVSPLLGLIPAIACSATPPKEHNLNYPNAELIKNPDYYHGYTQKAKKIKQGKVWKNLGIAFGVNLVAVILLSSGQ